MGLEGESSMEPEDRVAGPRRRKGMQQGRTGWERSWDRCGGGKKTDLGRRQDRLENGARRMVWARPGERNGIDLERERDRNWEEEQALGKKQ